MRVETSIGGPNTAAPWAFIGVMGVTGAGKSTFIKTATGDDSVEVGHSLESCTSELRGVTFSHDGYRVNLVDTPGFNDTHRSETEILQAIAGWLKDSYDRKIKLNGIIYVHSIASVRMEGSALRNLKMFRELCGDEPLKNVVLATTFWDKVDGDLAEQREEELRTTPDFWGQMIRRGSRLARFTDRDSALEIISGLIKREPIALEIQRELVEQGKDLIDTAAGSAVNEELKRLEAKHREEQGKLRQEMQEALKDKDEEMQRILEEQERKLDRELERVHRQQEQLRADRRADRRRLENELDWRVRRMEEDRKRDRELIEQYKNMVDMNFEQIVALLRANESKLKSDERETLEQKIEESSTQLDEKKKKRKGGARLLIQALQVIFPATTLALLGIPIPFPFGSGSGGDQP